LDHLRQQSRENLKRERERLKRRACDLRSNAANAAGIGNPEDFTPAVIPVNMRRIKNLPIKLQSEFRDRLVKMIDLITAARYSSTRSTDDSTIHMICEAQKQDTKLRLVLINACAICKGSCCTHGGEYDAYLKVDTLLHYMHQHPEMHERQVLEKYLSYLPEKTYEGSCVYHTEVGCVLPHDMRAEACNSFACDGLVEIEKHVLESKSTRFFIVAMEGKDILRSNFSDPLNYC
jgi:hypothetical protein